MPFQRNDVSAKLCYTLLHTVVGLIGDRVASSLADTTPVFLSSNLFFPALPHIKTHSPFVMSLCEHKTWF